MVNFSQIRQHFIEFEYSRFGGGGRSVKMVRNEMKLVCKNSLERKLNREFEITRL